MGTKTCLLGITKVPLAFACVVTRGGEGQYGYRINSSSVGRDSYGFISLGLSGFAFGERSI